jgi:hypothetical protein
MGKLPFLLVPPPPITAATAPNRQHHVRFAQPYGESVPLDRDWASGRFAVMIPAMPLRRLSATLALLVTIGAAPDPRTGTVILLKPYETATVSDKGLDKFRYQRLAGIDPARPLAGEPNTQTLSMFGREDLIAAASDDYRATACAPADGAGDVMGEIVKRARQTSVVIVNESHERSEHRGFTASLLPRLRAEGYTALAMEALSHPEADMAVALHPVFMRQPTLPYLEGDDGYYLSEAGFGRLGRTAKRLGYALIPYEERYDERSVNLPQPERIARREEAQASTLADWIGAHPGAKLIVHVGYSHATEAPRQNGDRWMATRLRAKTGIDPLTISQTTCRGGSASDRLAALPADEPAGTFDLVVDHPTARFVQGRPAWRMAAGDVPVAIPAALRPAKGWRVIEARPDGEPIASIPMDRVAIRPGEDIALMLPRGRYRLRVIDPPRNPEHAK